ncbi:MAG: hypothetical protein KJP00_01260, partial [Bacteroidia bacterium]|nr:hypothetical protein [Bacteroidia bacterium]
KLFKEYFTYQLFDLVDTIGMQTKLVDIRIGGVDSESFEFVGMLVEEEKHYTKRYDAELVPSERSLSWPAFDREHFVKMQFFQYMIANTDWAVVTKHNLEMVKFPNNLRVVAVPYDFDYAGVVGQHYARPAENLPITSVRDRYFVPYPVQEDEFDKMVEFYLDLEDEIYALCDSAIYMTQKSIDENKKFISKFFDILRKPQKFKPEVVKNIE